MSVPWLANIALTQFFREETPIQNMIVCITSIFRARWLWPSLLLTFPIFWSPAWDSIPKTVSSPESNLIGLLTLERFIQDGVTRLVCLFGQVRHKPHSRCQIALANTTDEYWLIEIPFGETKEFIQRTTCWSIPLIIMCGRAPCFYGRMHLTWSLTVLILCSISLTCLFLR